MTTPLGMLDYFAMEATEYLDRLRGLVEAPETPASELVRYARALRGAALMANQQPIARAANGLEGLARAVRDGQRGWDDTTREVAQRAITAIGGFVKKTAQWTAADGQAAEQLAKDLEALAGGAVAPLRTPSTSATPSAAAAALDAGARAFLARESALISAALGQAAQALRSAPPARDVLQGVLRRMQPLRGLAALGDLPPLPDLLDAVDRAVAEIGRLPSTPDGSAEVFEAAARALTRAAQDVTERGLPNADAEESQQFATLTLKTFSTPSGAVSIATLLADGESVTPGTTAAGPAATGAVERVELVSQGEYLVGAADDLDRARSITQRDLRLHALAASLRTLGEGAGGRIGDFTSLARDLIGQGAAARAPQDFAAALRSAGTAFQQIPDAGPGQALVDALNGSIAQLLALAGDAGATVAADAPVVAAEPAPKAASSFDSFFEADSRAGAPAPIPAAASAAPAASVAPVTSNGVIDLGKPGPKPTGGLGGSFASYSTMRNGTTPTPSIDALIAGKPLPPPAPAPAPAPVVVPPPRPAPATAAAPRPSAPAFAPAPAPAPLPKPAPVAAVAAPISADAVVDIKELCYSGGGALARAAEVRRELIEVLANPMKAGGKMRPLLDELLDLVELAQRS